MYFQHPRVAMALKSTKQVHFDRVMVRPVSYGATTRLLKKPKGTVWDAPDFQFIASHQELDAF